MTAHNTHQPYPEDAFSQSVVDALHTELADSLLLQTVAHIAGDNGMPVTAPLSAALTAYAVDEDLHRALALPRAALGRIDSPQPERKLVVHVAQERANPWTIAAAIDNRNVHWPAPLLVVWPRNGYPLEVLAAVLNGPVASALARAALAHETHRNIIGKLPLPRFSASALAATIDLVREYSQVQHAAPRTERDSDHVRSLVLRIDAEVLAAYDLPPRLERDLLTLYSGWPRPVAVSFDGYYPAEFQPALPLWRLISTDFGGTRADATVERLPTLHDAAISEMVADLDRV